MDRTDFCASHFFPWPNVRSILGRKGMERSRKSECQGPGSFYWACMDIKTDWICMPVVQVRAAQGFPGAGVDSQLPCTKQCSDEGKGCWFWSDLLIWLLLLFKTDEMQERRSAPKGYFSLEDYKNKAYRLTSMELCQCIPAEDSPTI